MIIKGRKYFVWPLVMIFLLTQILITPVIALSAEIGSGTGTAKDRIAGVDRYKTAVAVSQKGWETSDYAVLARGDDFADALCAAPLAQKYGGPILLTQPKQLNADTLTELKRLGVKHLFIAGGSGAIAQSVEDTLQANGIATIERIYGYDRYETSVKIAQKIGNTSKVVLAPGNDFPDALSISGIAAKLGMPILLTAKDSLPASVGNYFQTNSITQTYVVGGTAVISDEVANSVPAPSRLAGIDRYATNVAIMQNFASELNFDNIYVATGINFADALSGAVLAAKSSSPLVLIDKTMPTGTANYLQTKLKLSSKVFGLGGSSVVPSAVLTGIVIAKEQIPVEEKYSTAGTYGPETGSKTIQGSVIISARDVTLKNTIIEGDLLLGGSIGDGNVTLRDVTVKGKTIINGGGPHSIIMYNFNGQTVVVDLPDGGNVRLLAQGSTSLAGVSMESDGILEESGTSGGGFVNVEIPEGVQVTFIGAFAQVNVEGSGARINLPTGSSITTLNANAASNITGQGQITTANVNTDGVTIERTPTNTTTVASGLTAMVGGVLVSGTNNAPSGGGGGGGGNTVAPTISSVAVKTAPTKVAYTDAETLDLSGLVVTLTKTDASTQDVVFANFAANNITTVKAHGAGLVAADTTVVITVNGKTANQAITVVQAASANLTGLTLSGTPGNYTFAGGTYTYEGVAVANGVTSITITPTGVGTITVDGTPVATGTASGAIALTAGAEKMIDVIVTETGKTAKMYTIKVTRANTAGANAVVQTNATVIPVAGVANAITLTVRKSDNTTDTTFTGAKNVTVATGAGDSAPIGTRGSFAGTALDTNAKVISVTFSAGVATENLILHKAGTVQPTFSVAGVATPLAAPTTFTVGFAAANKAKIQTQPSSTVRVSGAALVQQPVIRIVDVYENVVTNSTLDVVAAIGAAGTGTSTIGGTTTNAAVAGVAIFTDLTLTNVGTGVTITFTPTGLTAATSNPIEVSTFMMIPVGTLGTTYTFPTGEGDLTIGSAIGGYQMAQTETTYELWYTVRVWAEINGYSFQHLGVEGRDHSNPGRVAGTAPSAASQEPVTTISWRDTIVWLNALSEMKGLNPVYRTTNAVDGTVIKSSLDANSAVVDAAFQTANNGYRLPTSMEWEMAARWIGTTDPATSGQYGFGTSLATERKITTVGGIDHYWTPGNYASGATADTNNSAPTKAVSVIADNTTANVKAKASNALAVYDMSGNAWEWCFDNFESDTNRVYRGGAFNNSFLSTTRVGRITDNASPSYDGEITVTPNHPSGVTFGFRMVRTLNP